MASVKFVLRCCMIGYLLWATGCASLLDSKQGGTPTEESRHCVTPGAAKGRPITQATHEENPDQPLPSTAARHSAAALHIAKIIGVLPLLNDMEKESREVSSQVHSLLLRQKLTDRILLAFFEVESATAEIVCERDRADQLADRIDETDGNRVKELTIASIVLGGLTGIVSGGIGLAAGASLGADIANVAGGTLATWFGISALYTHSEVDVRHERNILQELWEDPVNPVIFSPIVWRYLHQPSYGTTESPRTGVINAWRQKGRLGEQGSDDERQHRELFFGPGGRYAGSDLRARASMLETLEASLRLVHEELEILIRELVI